MLLSALSLLELKREIKENHTNNFFLSKIDYFLMKFTSVVIARTELKIQVYPMMRLRTLSECGTRTNSGLFSGMFHSPITEQSRICSSATLW